MLLLYCCCAATVLLRCCYCAAYVLLLHCCCSATVRLLYCYCDAMKSSLQYQAAGMTRRAVNKFSFFFFILALVNSSFAPLLFSLLPYPPPCHRIHPPPFRVFSMRRLCLLTTESCERERRGCHRTVIARVRGRWGDGRFCRP